MTDDVRAYYNQLGAREWQRLDEDYYGRINFLLHMDFIDDALLPGARVLDAGCGAGRFSVAFAGKGCRVTLLDLSEGQLAVAREKMAEHGLNGQAGDFVRGDIRDLSVFDDGSFDVTVCYGAPLSYVLDHRERAAHELMRVTRPGGTLAVSVNSKWGIFRMLLGRGMADFFSRPQYWYIDRVMESGDLPRHEKVSQPPRHFFEAGELRSLLSDAGLRDVTLAGSPCLGCGSAARVNELCRDEAAFGTILELERAAYRNPAMADAGEFLLARGTK